MKDEIEVNQELKKAFNEGYLLGYYRDELGRQLSNQIKKNQFELDTQFEFLINGLNEGIRRVISEKELNQRLIELQNIRENLKGNEQNRDID